MEEKALPFQPGWPWFNSFLNTHYLAVCSWTIFRTFLSLTFLINKMERRNLNLVLLCSNFPSRWLFIFLDNFLFWAFSLIVSGEAILQRICRHPGTPSRHFCMWIVSQMFNHVTHRANLEGEPAWILARWEGSTLWKASGYASHAVWF